MFLQKDLIVPISAVTNVSYVQITLKPTPHTQQNCSCLVLEVGNEMLKCLFITQ
jgi:hypothetical protein